MYALKGHTPRPVSLSTSTISLDKYGFYLNVPHTKEDVFDEIVRREGITEEEILQLIIDRSHPGLRMYGTGRELCDSLGVFRDFPGNRDFFDTAENDMANSTLHIQKSLRQSELVNKQEALAFMEYLIMSSYSEEAFIMTRAMTCFLMRHYERKLDGCYEFIPKNSYTAIIQSIVDLSKQTVFAKEHIPLELHTFTTEELNSQWKGMLGWMWDEELHHNFYPLMDGFLEKFPIKKFAPMHKMAFAATQIVIEVSRKVVEGSPMMFLPYLGTPKNTMPITVRIFDDNSHRFVMKSEVIKAIAMYHFTEENLEPFQKSLSLLEIPCGEADNMCSFVSTLSTGEMAALLKEHGVAMGRIELMITPIMRAKHSAVPIMTASGDHCKLAVDVLLETLRTMIFGMHLFQANADHWGFISFMFAALEPWFRTDRKDSYFLKFCQIHEIESCLAADKFQFQDQTVHVSNVSRRGFTVEDLMDELAELRLLSTFPEILDHAQLAFDTVMSKKKEKMLRTIDLFDAVEHCQLLCIFQRVPKLAEFLHLQHSCHRIIGLKCAKCAEIPEPVTLEKVKPLESIKEVVPEEHQNPVNYSYTVQVDFRLPTGEESACQQCKDSAEKCKIAEDSLKSAQNKWKTQEKKLRGSMAQQEKELEKVRVEVEHKDRMIGEVKRALAGKEESVKKLQSEIGRKEHNEARIGQQLVEERKKSKNLEKELESLKKEKQAEISKKEQNEARFNQLLAEERKKSKNLEKELERANKRLTKETSTKNEEIHVLREQLSALQKTCDSLNPVAASAELQKMLVKLMCTRSKMHKEQVLEQANETVATYLRVSRCERHNRCASKELELFVEKYEKFMETLEANIRRIQTDPSITRDDLSPYPPFPAFTSTFMHEYEKLMKQQQLLGVEQELEDRECLVCLQNMDGADETIKCQHCKRRYHEECVTEWLKRKSVCPACNRGLLDAAEYPPLT